MLRMLQKTRYRPFLEWGGWCLLVLLLWQQTDHFDQPMSEFLFGADGWPKAVLCLLLLGATAQMASDIAKQRKRQATKTPSNTMPNTKPKTKTMSWYQVMAVFCLPLVYVFMLRRIGFFVATPLFILAYLWTLEVRRGRHLLAVTITVFAVILLVFVRFFYVALPVGSWEWAYAVNNAIIAIVRAGL